MLYTCSSSYSEGGEFDTSLGNISDSNHNNNNYNHNNVKMSSILRVVVKLLSSEKRNKENLLVGQMLQKTKFT